jgi:hypothetical protein
VTKTDVGGLPHGSYIVTDNSAVIAALNVRIVELEKERLKMIECFCDISDACLGEITMNYKVDAEEVGRGIYEATGMTNPQLKEALKAVKQ